MKGDIPVDFHIVVNVTMTSNQTRKYEHLDFKNASVSQSNISEM
jgi:hypothetical protein